MNPPNPPEKTSDEGGSSPALMDALRSTNVELAEYAGDFFELPELQTVTDAVLASHVGAVSGDIFKQSRAWLDYLEASAELVDLALMEGGDEAFTRAEISARIHQAMIYRALGNVTRYFGELKKTERYVYEEGLAEDDQIDTAIYDELEAFLSKTTLTSESVEAFLLSHEVLSKENMASLNEDIRNGFGLQDILGEIYEMLEVQGDDPEVIFRQLGFPETIPE